MIGKFKNFIVLENTTLFIILQNKNTNFNEIEILFTTKYMKNKMNGFTFFRKEERNTVTCIYQ